MEFENVQVGAMLEVRFPNLNKNNTLFENDAQLAEGSYFERCRVEQVVTLDDPQVLNHLLRDNPSWSLEGQPVGGTQSTDPRLEGFTCEQVWRDPALMAIFRETSYNLVTLVLIPHLNRALCVDTQGYEYARYVGCPCREV